MNKNGWLYDFMADIQQILPADYICNLSVSYLPNSMTLQSHTNGIWTSIIAISKSYLNNRLNVSLSGITNLNKGSRAKTDTVTEGNDFTYINSMLMPWKDVMLNVTYSFGGSDYIKVKKSRKKNIDNDQLDLD